MPKYKKDRLSMWWRKQDSDIWCRAPSKADCHFMTSLFPTYSDEPRVYPKMTWHTLMLELSNRGYDISTFRIVCDKIKST